MSFTNNPRGRNINGYVPARLVEGTRWYVEFYSFDPDSDSMGRKRYYVPKFGTLKARRQYASDMILNINERLRDGWNPFLKLSNPKEYALFKDVCDTYYRYMWQLTQDDLRRKNTYNGYISFLTQFMKWNSEQEKPVVYVYQLKNTVINEFLDYLWIDLQRKPRTRDNYLGWLRTFCGWMVEKHYISENPTNGITPLQGKRKVEKNRTVIPKCEMIRLREHLMEKDRYFLLACYILYYCFVRPREMSFVKVGDISVQHSTISIGRDSAKNRRDAVVTVPDCVMKLMIELHVLECPSDWYLFSWDCMPGKDYRLPKYFSDMWHRTAVALGFRQSTSSTA